MTAVPQNQLTISRRALDIEDYIDIARRHISWIVGPLYAGIVISTMVAFFLPNVYVSRAVLRITPPQIPENLVPATFSQQMTDSMQSIWQEVVSRSSLAELIQKPSLDLYKPERNRKPLEDVIEDMRKDVKLDYIGVQTGGKPNAAFAISFPYPDRFKAQSVVSAIVGMLTNANQSRERNGVTNTNDLLSDEVKAAKDAVEKLDQDLTAFKQSNNGRLPEQLTANVAEMESYRSRLNGVQDQLNRNEQQKLISEQTLASLKGQYAQMESSLTGSSPEETVIQSTKIEQNQELVQLKHEITQMEAQLAVMRKSLTDQHPDMIDYRAKLDALKQRYEQMKKEDETANAAALASESGKPKSAAPKRTMSFQNQQSLQSVKTQIESTTAQLTALELARVKNQKEEEALSADMARVQGRIEASPINEQKYASLMRDRTVAAERYEELSHKQQLAEQGKDVTARKAGENLELLDPANLPETPTAPNRWQIVAFGVFGGLVAGLGMAGAKEMKDTSLKNLKDVRAYTNLPVLSSIPLLENALLLRRKRRLAYVGWSVAVILGLLGTAISFYYHVQYGSK